MYRERERLRLELSHLLRAAGQSCPGRLSRLPADMRIPPLKIINNNNNDNNNDNNNLFMFIAIFMYIHIYIYICVHVHIYIYIYTYIYMYIYVWHTYIRT